MTIKEIKKLSDMELIMWLQKINKPEQEKIYSKEFIEAINKEVLKRGDKD